MKVSRSGIYPGTAKRVVLGKGDDGSFAITFFKTFTSAKVDPVIEDHMLTVMVNPPALGEIFLSLKKEIDKDPKKFGFTPVSKTK